MFWVKCLSVFKVKNPPSNSSSVLSVNDFKFVPCDCCVVEVSAENIRTCFQIVNAYLYLSAVEFLQVSDWHLPYIPRLKHLAKLPLISSLCLPANRTMQSRCAAPSAICSVTLQTRDKFKFSRYRCSTPFTGLKHALIPA